MKLEIYKPEQHLDILIKWFSDLQLMQDMGMQQMTKEELESWLIESDRVNLILYNDEETAIGYADFYNHHTISPDYEIGYLIDPSYQGKGDGRQMMKLLLDYARDVLKARNLTEVYVQDFNIASRKLLETNGFKLYRYDKVKRRLYYSLELPISQLPITNDH